jgi:hypothetical protein
MHRLSMHRRRGKEHDPNVQYTPIHRRLCGYLLGRETNAPGTSFIMSSTLILLPLTTTADGLFRMFFLPMTVHEMFTKRAASLWGAIPSMEILCSLGLLWVALSAI